MRRLLVALGAALAALSLLSAGQIADAAAAKKRTASPPWDIVLILTDDQPTGTLPGMPEVSRLLMARGVTFPNAIVPTSLCCPSRTSLLTGKLATATGIYSNESDTGYGGYPAVRAAGLENDTVATALDAAGYRTGYFGKYLNEYGPFYTGVAPPGWDTWRVFTTTTQSGRYRNYGLSDGVPFGQRAGGTRQEFVRQYSTTRLGRLAADSIRSARPDQPLFTVLAPYAPHSPFTAERKYRGTSRLPGDYRNPSVNEVDVSDKPAYVQQVPLIGTVEGQAPGANLAKQFGYLHGEHRLDGKGYPYLKSTNVPLVMRWGAGGPAVVDPRLTVANVDVTATILQAAGLPNRSQGTPVGADRNQQGVPLVGIEPTSRVIRPPFCAWRTREELFVRYGTGEEEYYDYRVDPYELVNRVSDQGLRVRVDELRALTRAACDPPPPGFGPAFDLPRWRSQRGAAPVPWPDTETDQAARAD